MDIFAVARRIALPTDLASTLFAGQPDRVAQALAATSFAAAWLRGRIQTQHASDVFALMVADIKGNA